MSKEGKVTIEDLIGAEAAQKLREAFGGEKVYVAKSFAGQKRKRALRLAQKGYTIESIASAMSLSKSQIYRLLKKPK